MTTTPMPTATRDAVTHLRSLGFTSSPDGRRFVHPHAEVRLLDPDAVCFEVVARSRDRARLGLWEVRLTRAPHDVFTATVAAAIS